MIIIYEESQEECSKNLRACLDTLAKNDLHLNKEKCSFSKRNRISRLYNSKWWNTKINFKNCSGPKYAQILECWRNTTIFRICHVLCEIYTTALRNISSLTPTSSSRKPIFLVKTMWSSISQTKNNYSQQASSDAIRSNFTKNYNYGCWSKWNCGDTKS